MGKTASGAVWLDPAKTSPFDFYQYWRNVDDGDVMKCIRMLTFFSLEEIEAMECWDGSRINEKKELLAYHLTALVHGQEDADRARATAQALFSGAGDDSNMPQTRILEEQLTDGSITVAELLVLGGLAKSRSEARRLMEQGGISLDGERVEALDSRVDRNRLAAGVKIRKGKKVYHKFFC